MTTLQIAGSGSSPYQTNGSWAASNAGGTYKDFGSFNVPTSGYWCVELQYSYDNGAGQADLYTRWTINGAAQAEVPYIWTSRTGVLQAYLRGLWGAGTQLRYQARSTNGGPYLNNHEFVCTFVPTPDYRI